ncbi:NmrA family NAD(P)-binding protein [Streptomyces lonegramiae]|uniref:NmrA family NAD(P)-binding protein n=1 Tax=Streptomyces lonegramiae TaxID=3075524 RepID=A0ABU2XBK7_9ACTN|nr:NmrA family NAD(P)-binding protein [Streptomyces sp. DSM 41529]MDT0543305.1 NmrA family NAD(P)-binding protein [Streptomyces sp. DSM 41529]
MTTASAHAPVLVTGATGKQGGATARALLAQGIPVRALVRDPGSERARALAELGAQFVTGDLRDRDAVARAVDGVRAVFSVQMPDLADLQGDAEWVCGRNLIDAAAEAGVEQLVHTSVSGAGQHREEPGWAEGRWKAVEHYYETKTALQDRGRDAGFRYWTLLKPGFFMENFLEPGFMFGSDGRRLVTVLKPDTVLKLIAVQDIGHAAAAAFADPERFHGVELELASDELTMTEVAAVLSRASGTELAAPDMTVEEAIAAGMPPVFSVSYDRLNVVGQPASPRYALALGLSVTGFEEWARGHGAALPPARQG